MGTFQDTQGYLTYNKIHTKNYTKNFNNQKANLKKIV